MSIIHDALKKVQRSMTDAPASSPLDQEPRTNPASNKPSTRRSVILFILLAGIIGYALIILLTTPKKNVQQPLPAPSQAPVIQTTITTPAPSNPVPNDNKTTPAFTLNFQGVMSTPTGHVALINDKVYEEGAIIEGRRIKAISLDRITIDHEGKIEEIPLKK